MNLPTLTRFQWVTIASGAVATLGVGSWDLIGALALWTPYLGLALFARPKEEPETTYIILLLLLLLSAFLEWAMGDDANGALMALLVLPVQWVLVLAAGTSLLRR